MIFTLPRFQEHMIDDNYSAQACMRADPASVRPEDFKIARIRSPIGPENLLRYCADEAAGVSLAKLIDDMASRNKPPRLVAAGGGTVPLFEGDYDWAEQKRVRKAIDTAMRTKSDDLWWRMRASEHDNRYVLTASRGGTARNFTVGDLCGDIVDLRLCLGFTSHLPSVPGRLPPAFGPEQEFAEHEAEWARERQTALRHAGRPVREGNGAVGTDSGDTSGQRWAVARLFGRGERDLRRGDEKANRRFE